MYISKKKINHGHLIYRDIRVFKIFQLVFQLDLIYLEKRLKFYRRDIRRRGILAVI